MPQTKKYEYQMKMKLIILYSSLAYTFATKQQDQQMLRGASNSNQSTNQDSFIERVLQKRNLPNGHGCSFGFECQSERCSLRNSICEEKLNLSNGSLCGYNDECESGNCSFKNGVCQEKFANGSSCERRSECLSELCDDISNMCVQKRAEGESCRFSFECETKFCHGNICLTFK